MTFLSSLLAMVPWPRRVLVCRLCGSRTLVRWTDGEPDKYPSEIRCVDCGYSVRSVAPIEEIMRRFGRYVWTFKRLRAGKGTG